MSEMVDIFDNEEQNRIKVYRERKVQLINKYTDEVSAPISYNVLWYKFKDMVFKYLEENGCKCSQCYELRYPKLDSVVSK